MDIVSPATRSKMMSGIKAKNTKPELVIRKGLFASGYRYSLHSKKLPGKPDIVLTKHKVVIFVHGCFWHMHNCPLFVLPKTRTEFWQKKLQENVERDSTNIRNLKSKGWRIAIIWECAIKKKKPSEIKSVIEQLDNWIKSSSTSIEIP